MNLKLTFLFLLSSYVFTSNAQQSIYNQLDIAFVTPADLDLHPQKGKIIDKMIVADFDSVGTKFRMKKIEVFQFKDNRIVSRKVNFYEPGTKYDYGAFHVIYKYDKQKNLTEVQHFNAKDNKEASKQIITYDTQSRPISMQDYEGNNVLYKLIFTYDANRITIKEYDQKNTLESSTILNLNAQKQIASRRNGGTGYARNIDYTYSNINIAGRNVPLVIKERETKEKRGHTIKYNTKGDRVELEYSQTIGLGAISNKYVCDYNYGSYGLWLERYRIKKGAGRSRNTELELTRRMITYTDGTTEGSFVSYFTDTVKTKWGGKVKLHLPLAKYEFRPTEVNTTTRTPAVSKSTKSTIPSDNNIDDLVDYYLDILNKKDKASRYGQTDLIQQSYDKIQKDNSIKDKSAYIATFMERLHKKDASKKLLLSFMMSATPLEGWKAGLDKTSAQTQADVRKAAQGVMTGYNKHIQKINDKNKR